MRTNFTIKRYGHEFDVCINEPAKSISLQCTAWFDAKGGPNSKPYKFNTVVQCHPDDTFNVKVGINIGIRRILVQLFGKEKEIINRMSDSIIEHYTRIISKVESKIPTNCL